MNARSVYTMLGSIALLAAWIGVAVFLAVVVAPESFAVLPTRALAGALVGNILPMLFIAGVEVGGVLAVSYWSSARTAAVGSLLLFAGSAFAQMIAHRVHTLLAAVGAPIDTLPLSDPRRIEFGRLHGLSALMMGIGILGATASVVALMRRIVATASIPGPSHIAHSDAPSN